mgnify:FL=1|jgi:hypothetical protein
MISLGLPAGHWGILVKGPGTRTRMKVWSFGGICDVNLVLAELRTLL